MIALHILSCPFENIFMLNAWKKNFILNNITSLSSMKFCCFEFYLHIEILTYWRTTLNIYVCRHIYKGDLKSIYYLITFYQTLYMYQAYSIYQGYFISESNTEIYIYSINNNFDDFGINHVLGWKCNGQMTLVLHYHWWNSQ